MTITSSNAQAGMQPDGAVTVSGPQPVSLRRNVSWVLTGNVVYALSQWGMLVAVAKLGSPSEVGQFALAVAITTPVFALASLQLRGLQATDTRRDFPFEAYLSLRLITTLLAVVIVAGLIVALDFSRTLAWIVVVSALGRAMDALSDIAYGHFQQQEAMRPIAEAMALNGILSFALLCLGFGATNNLVVGVAGSSLASAVVALFHVLPRTSVRIGQPQMMLGSGRHLAAQDFLRAPDVSGIASLARIALPLGVVMALVSLNGNVPRFFLQYVGGDRELGLFAALAYLTVAGSLMVTALGQAASPRLARYFFDGDRQRFVQLLSLLVGAGIIGGLLGSAVAQIAGKQVLALLYTSDYGEQQSILVVISAAAGLAFASSFTGYALTAARRLRSQVPIQGLTLGVLIVACATFIPKHGLMGAAVSTFLGSLVQLGASAIVLARALRCRDQES